MIAHPNRARHATAHHHLRVSLISGGTGDEVGFRIIPIRGGHHPPAYAARTAKLAVDLIREAATLFPGDRITVTEHNRD